MLVSTTVVSLLRSLVIDVSVLEGVCLYVSKATKVVVSAVVLVVTAAVSIIVSGIAVIISTLISLVV